MEQMAGEAAGPQAAKDIVSGVGTGLILKTLTINYRVSTRIYERDHGTNLYMHSIATSHLSRYGTKPYPIHNEHPVLTSTTPPNPTLLNHNLAPHRPKTPLNPTNRILNDHPLLLPRTKTSYRHCRVCVCMVRLRKVEKDGRAGEYDGLVEGKGVSQGGGVEVI